MTIPSQIAVYIQANGKEGFVGNGSYLMLWDPREIAELNRSYHVEMNAPGLLVFGSDGGGEAFGFDTRKTGWPVVRIPFILMKWEYAIPVGETFPQFIEILRHGSAA